MARRSPLIALVVLLLALLATASPGPVPNELERRVEHLRIVLERRQDNNNGTAPQPPVNTPTTVSPPPPPPKTTPETVPPSTPNDPKTTPTTTTPNPPPASSKANTSPTKDTPTPSTSEPPSFTTTVKSTLAPTTKPVITIFTTKSDNQDVVMTSTSLVIETPVIDVAVPVGKNGLSGKDNDDGSSGGLSTKQKNIVIGVVVGVGGAILLGALAIVVFRVRKKRNSPMDEDDYLNGRREGSPLSSSRKEGSEMGSSPFQATLDQYHRQPVNASSNF